MLDPSFVYWLRLGNTEALDGGGRLSAGFSRDWLSRDSKANSSKVVFGVSQVVGECSTPTDIKVRVPVAQNVAPY